LLLFYFIFNSEFGLECVISSHNIFLMYQNFEFH